MIEHAPFQKSAFIKHLIFSQSSGIKLEESSVL